MGKRFSQILSLLMACVLLFSWLPAAAEEEVLYGRVNLDKVRFRKSATSSASGEWWCLLNTGWVVLILDTVRADGTDWYKIRCNIPESPERNYTGFIMAKYITPMTAEEQAAWLLSPFQPDGATYAYLATTETGPSRTAAPNATQAPAVPTAAPTAAPTAQTVTAAPTSQTTLPPDSGSAAYGRTTVDKVFFRQLPNSELYWELLPQNWVLQILDSTVVNGITWYKVEGGIPSDPQGDYVGYVHGGFFSPLNETASSAPTSAPTQAPAVTATPAAASTTAAPVVPGETIGQITTDKVFFRRSAGYESAYWALLPTGWQLTVLDTVKVKNVTWYKVKGGIPASPDRVYTGYVHSDFLRIISGGEVSPTAAPTAEAMSGYGLITVNGTNVRTEANGTSTSLTALAEGTLVAVRDSSNASYTLVSYNNSITGYVPVSSVQLLTVSAYNAYLGTNTPTPVPGVETATPSPTATNSGQTPADGSVLGYIRLTKGGVNMRRVPNGASLTPTENEWLPRGLILGYYREPSYANGYYWAYVYYNGMYGYIRSDCYEILSDAPTPSVTATPVPGQSGTIRLTAGGVNLRYRATTESDVYGRLNRDTLLPYYSITMNGSTKWYFVYSSQYDVYGYIMGNFAQEVSDAPTATAAPTSGTVTQTPSVTNTPAPSLGMYAATSVDKVWVRSNTSTSSSTLGQIAARLTVLPMTANPVTVNGVTWYPVRYNNQNGYIHGGFAFQLSEEQVQIYLATGSIPQPTASPTPAPVGNSSYIYVDENKVWIRTGAGTNFSTVSSTSQANKGDVFEFTTTRINGSTTWYRIIYNSSTVAYISGRYCHVMTLAEYAAWAANQTAAPTATPGSTTAAPTATPGTDTYRTLRIGMSGDDVTRLQQALADRGYLSESDVTGQYTSATATAVRKYQKAFGLTEDGVAGVKTQTSLYSENSQYSGLNYEDSSVNVTLNPVEYVDWYTGDIQTVWARGTTAIITDVYTGISFRARRWSGGYHADVEPLTAADTAAICAIYKVSSAQEIEDYYQQLEAWRRRPAWVTIGTRTFAASLYLVPHNYPDGDTIADNNFRGQFCVHFVNSRTHTGNTVDTDNANNAYFGHQSAIKYAYEHSISGNK